MKDFLDGSKIIFYMESDLSNENEISGIVEDQLIPKPVDLSYYARDHIQNYETVTEIPQDNLNYLNSGLVASDMSCIFIDCYKLQSIPKLNIDTSQCIDMDNMFGNCRALTAIDLSNWNTNSVTSMFYMFYNCESLTTIDLSNFNTSKVTDMRNMFSYCQALTAIDLSNFDTNNVISMIGMFNNCINLEHIEGIIDMKSCTMYDMMFLNCPKLSGVKIKNPPQAYYGNKEQFESSIGLASSQYEIVS